MRFDLYGEIRKSLHNKSLNQNKMRQLLQLLTDIDNLEDFIKISAIDNKINSQTASELLRIIKEAKTRALK